jgi:hypothetical protein
VRVSASVLGQLLLRGEHRLRVTPTHPPTSPLARAANGVAAKSHVPRIGDPIEPAGVLDAMNRGAIRELAGAIVGDGDVVLRAS